MASTSSKIKRVMKTHRMILSEEERSDDESKDTSTGTAWFVYILLCEDNSLYTGCSNNPKQRFIHHKEGKGGRYTQLHKPVKILYTEWLLSKPAALKRELQIKGWSHSKKIKVLKLKI